MKCIMIGCGQMGSAILASWIAKKVFTEIHIVDPVFITSTNVSDEIAITIHRNVNELQTVPNLSPNVILIAIKPQQANEVLPHYKKYKDAIVMSIMAGKTIEYLQNVFDANTKIARIMPNICAKTGNSTSLLCQSDNIQNDTDLDIIQKCVTSFGSFFTLTENQFTNITLITGCAPAYFYTLCNSMQKELITFGVTEEQAQKIVTELFTGSCNLIKNNMESDLFMQMINKVTSKGGITEKVLEHLTPNIDNGLQNGIKAGIMHSNKLAS